MATSENRRRQRWFGWGIMPDHPDATSTDVVENNNEINSNYMDSMEDDTSNVASYSFDELTGSFSLDDDEFIEDFINSIHDTGLDEIDMSDEEESDSFHNNIVDAPDPFIVEAQNDYNSQIEQLLQESVAAQPRVVEREDTVDVAIQNSPFTRNVEVDLLGIEASTTLILLGMGVFFISRWYAIFYFLLVIFLLYWLRLQSIRERERAMQLNLLIGAHLLRYIPQALKEVVDAIKLVGKVIGLLCLLPFMLVMGTVWLIGLLSSAHTQAGGRGIRGNADLKFLVQVIFFPFFIPYWLSKIPQLPRLPATNGPLWQFGRFLLRAGRHR